MRETAYRYPLTVDRARHHLIIELLDYSIISLLKTILVIARREATRQSQLRETAIRCSFSAKDQDWLVISTFQTTENRNSNPQLRVPEKQA